MTSHNFGHRRLDFEVPGSFGGFMILPAIPAPGNPWLWYAPSFISNPYPLPKPLHAWYLTRVLDAGIAVGGVDVGEAWGSPAGREFYTRFHAQVVREFKLEAKARLLGQSRGGLFHYNWAADHPDCVRSIAGIYPVCDVLWPARLETISKAYGLPTERIIQERSKHNPVERLGALAAAHVPVFHIHGDSDDVVPLENNSAELVRRYRELGGTAELLVVPGVGHKEVPEFFENARLLDFLINPPARSATK